MSNIQGANLKIAMLAGSYPPDIKGGGEISTKILAQILTHIGCKVEVLTCGSEESYTDEDGTGVYRTISPNVYWDFRAKPSRFAKLEWHTKENVNVYSTRRVASFLKLVEPDLLVTSTLENFGAGAWTAAHELKIPSVHVLRSYYPFCFRGSARRNGSNCEGQCLDCNLFSLGRKIASQHVNGVVGISDYILKRHQSHGFFKHAATVVIGEPIAKELFENKVNLLQPARFGYLGVLSSDKGLESLVQAWTQCELEGCSLTIAGQGKEPYVARIRALFPPEVKFSGWVESSEFLKEIDFLIVPSIWHEPFGRVVIEAFAKGVPVIGSRIGGIAETVVNGRNGFTYTPNDSNELARLLTQCSRMSKSEHQELSLGAFQDVFAYESNHIANAHLSFYKEVVADFKSPGAV